MEGNLFLLLFEYIITFPFLSLRREHGRREEEFEEFLPSPGFAILWCSSAMPLGVRVTHSS